MYEIPELSACIDAAAPRAPRCNVTERGSSGSFVNPIFGLELALPEAMFVMKSPVMTELSVDMPIIDL